MGGVCLEWLNLITSFYSFLYSVALAAGMLVSLPYWLFQMARHGKYRKGFAERLGRVPARLQLPGDQERVIWVHAVSVGEVLAVAGLVDELQQRFRKYRIFVSTTTDTGQALARNRFGEANVFYFPMDFAFAIRPYLRALRPQMVVIAETEFWPNFIRLAHAQRRANCSGERAHLGPLVAALPAISRIAAKTAGERGSVSGADAGGRRAVARYRSQVRTRAR